MDLKKVCRCCLEEECFKDLSTEYYHDGKTEVYSKMLLDTFNIYLSSHADVQNLICEDCIKRLRDAVDFKKKVEAAEDSLLKMLKEELKEIEGFPLKEEFDDYDFDDRVDDSLDDNFAWDVDDTALQEKGQIFVIKLEPKNENEIKKVNKPDTIKMEIPLTDDKTGKRKSSVRTRNVTRRKQDKKVGNRQQSTDKKRSRRRKEPTSVSETQIALRENSLNLVLNSNMCLFKSLKTKFGCFHCKESYITMPELREHSKTHSDVKNIKIRFNSLRGLSYKSVDISRLSCKLCSSNCDSLDGLKSHLVEKHNVQFKDGDHFLIPFNLENDFKCLLCGKNFNTFTRLAIHMNSHYAHNVCEICGFSYINRMSLRTHVHAVHREKKCSKCPATFSSQHSRVQHMQKAHNVGAYKRYCLLCNKSFRYTYLLDEHKIQEHGAKRQIVNCTDCGKTFNSPSNLKVHVRSVHIRERNYPCTVCDLRFFTKCDQKRHEMTHEDVKSFSCGHCDGRFKTKDSWRRHLKRQHQRLYESQ